MFSAPCRISIRAERRAAAYGARAGRYRTRVRCRKAGDAARGASLGVKNSQGCAAAAAAPVRRIGASVPSPGAGKQVWRRAAAKLIPGSGDAGVPRRRGDEANDAGAGENARCTPARKICRIPPQHRNMGCFRDLENDFRCFNNGIAKIYCCLGRFPTEVSGKRPFFRPCSLFSVCRPHLHRVKPDTANAHLCEIIVFPGLRK